MARRRAPLHLDRQNAEEQHLKRTTRAQVIEWARQLGLGRASGFSVESEADGFLQLMHAYGLGVWYGGAAPALRSVVVLDPQWIVDAMNAAPQCVRKKLYIKSHLGACACISF